MISMYEIDLTSILPAIGAVLFLLYYFRRPSKRRNSPSALRGLPFVGYIPFIGENPAETYMELTKKYGPIFSVRLATQDWIVLNDYDIIQEALVKQGHMFSSRPNLFMLQRFSGGNGLIMLNHGERFKSQRKFGVKNLKRFGYNKSSMESMIVEEIEYLCEVLESRKGNPFNCQNVLSSAVANVISRLAIGSRFSYDDERFTEMVKRSNECFSGLDGALFGIMNFMPFTRFLPVFWGSYNRYKRNNCIVKRVLQDIIEEHKDSFDGNNSRDFIDEFLREIELNGANDKWFNEEQLLIYLWDLFSAGTETSSSALRWSVLCIAHYPEHQKKIFREISEVIGSAHPSMEHQFKMPYTRAFILEISRHRGLSPLGVPHMTDGDVKLRGFDIPKNTPIMANTWAVHHDPKRFQDPEQFRPERFIDDNNCFVPSPHVIPFSVGPRACLGEQMARMEMFLFLVGILQKFRIVHDHEKALPSFNKGVFGMVYGAYEFHIKFQQR